VTEVLGYDPDFQPFTWQEEGAGRRFLEDFDVGLEAIRTEGTIIHS
jgi:hypothetical protein